MLSINRAIWFSVARMLLLVFCRTNLIVPLSPTRPYLLPLGSYLAQPAASQPASQPASRPASQPATQPSIRILVDLQRYLARIYRNTCVRTSVEAEKLTPAGQLASNLYEYSWIYMETSPGCIGIVSVTSRPRNNLSIIFNHVCPIMLRIFGEKIATQPGA